MSNTPNTPMSDDPDVLRRQIAETRGDLSRDVNALGEAVSPGNVARRQAEKVTGSVKDAGRSLKDKVMGSDDPYDTSPGMVQRAQFTAQDAGHGVSDSVSDFAGSARDAVTDAPAMARARTQGNPLAAGLIALGVGWLVGSLLPASEKERELATTVKEQAQEQGRPLVDEAKTVAQDVVDHVRPQAEEAVENVKSTAQDSVENVKEDASSTASGVQDSAQDSARSVKDQNQQG